MAPRDNDWSDDEDEVALGVETDVLLGVPDGECTSSSDLTDAAVSRIGGTPALLTSPDPPISSSHCKSCSQPMELLVQMWCPFENSPMDRALYVWGCARSGCQGKDGSVRAWRGLRYNEKYALKLKNKLSRQQSEAAREKEHGSGVANNSKKSMSNPFSMSSASEATVIPTFGLGTQLFSSQPLDLAEKKTTIGTTEDGSSPHSTDDLSDTDSDESLITALEATKLQGSAWLSVPSYPTIYLSTVSEYLPPSPQPVLSKDVLNDDGLQDNNKKGDADMSWAKEAYENSLDTDQVFDRFTKRVAHEGQQCVRYELTGIPLPFCSDKVFDLLWPQPKQPPLPVTKADFKVVHQPKRVYSPSVIPCCPACKAARVFECQLMPNLINVLRPTWEGASGDKKLTNEERRKAVEKALKKSAEDKDTKKGMEWGTCMIFSCKNDCCVEGGAEFKQIWREELVYIQWDM